jgi:hypothetical protein
MFHHFDFFSWRFDEVGKPCPYSKEETGIVLVFLYVAMHCPLASGAAAQGRAIIIVIVKRE